MEGKESWQALSLTGSCHMTSVLKFSWSISYDSIMQFAETSGGEKRQSLA